MGGAHLSGAAIGAAADGLAADAAAALGAFPGPAGVGVFQVMGVLAAAGADPPGAFGDAAFRRPRGRRLKPAEEALELAVAGRHPAIAAAGASIIPGHSPLSFRQAV